MSGYQIVLGDCINGMKTLQTGSVQCCVTSPPYWGLRDYGHPGQIGLEETPQRYVARMVEVFSEVRRVLRDDGTLWLNLGDSYAAGTPHRDALKHGLKHKDLVGIPWRVAFALQADGWYLRQDIIWHKPNPMPESVRDRCTKAHEYVFLLSKSERYYYDSESIKLHAVSSSEGIRFGGNKYGDSDDSKHKTKSGNVSKEYLKANRRSVWTLPTKPYSGAHFAVMPEGLVEPCIRAGTREGETVLDPFAGSGTVGVVALRWGRKFIGCELNPEYVSLAHARIKKEETLFPAEAR